MTYPFDDPEPVAHMIIVVGFHTDKPNVALAQLEGEDFRHLTLTLMDGFLTLHYSLKKKEKEIAGFETDDEVKSLRITKRRLNNGKHNIARVYITTDNIHMSVPNYGYEMKDEVAERVVQVDQREVFVIDKFGKPVKITIGRAANIKSGLEGTLPTSYDGCMSGAKVVLNPHATTLKRFRQAIELDLFKMLDEAKNSNNDNNNVRNPTGDLPATECGSYLPGPGN